MYRAREKRWLAPLRATDLFGDCTDAELAEVDNLLTQITIPEGVDAVDEGARGREFFIIRDGLASVSKHGQHLGRLGAGAFFGEIALLESGMRTATVRATTEMRVWVMSRPEFRELLWRLPRVEEQVVLAAEQRRDADDLVRAGR